MQRNQNGSRGSLILKSAISRPGSGIALLCGFLLLLGILQLNHAYNGIFHDARLYLLQAIARSHPDSLTHDLFLSFGSQDRYTLFSGPYAAFIALAGIPLAAALGTALSQCALVLSGWVLARALMADRLALVGIVGFVALPGFYGPGHVFSVIEGFLTPRMLAEALVLLSLAALLKARYATGSVALIMAALVHPIIAAAGVICVTSWFCIHGQLLQRMRKILFFTRSAIHFRKSTFRYSMESRIKRSNTAL